VKQNKQTKYQKNVTQKEVEQERKRNEKAQKQ